MMRPVISIINEKSSGYTGNDSEGFSEAYEYFKAYYKRVQKEDIEAFAKEYRFSKEEEGDVLKFYTEYRRSSSITI